MILLITIKSDLHADLVEKHIKNSNTPYFRLNTDQLSHDYFISFGIRNNNEFFGYIRSKDGTEILNTDEVNAVWYRRTRIDVDPKTKDHDIIEYSLSEHMGFFRNLWITLNKAIWMDTPNRVHHFQDHRLAQYEIAAGVGLKFPDTWYTNNPETVQESLEVLDKIAFKPISTAFVRTTNTDGNKKAKIILTTLIKKGDFSKRQLSASLRHTPIQFQNYINKEKEIRLTVVGEEFFPCEIDSQVTERTMVDWRRYDFSKVAHTPCILDPEMKEKILNLMRIMGLNFGAIDLIRKPNGEYIFLEINPAGQWQWIEAITGLEISKAIANWLIERSRRKSLLSDSVQNEGN